MVDEDPRAGPGAGAWPHRPDGGPYPQDILGKHRDAVVIEEYRHAVTDSPEAVHALK
jgi:hypothetical protein